MKKKIIWVAEMSQTTGCLSKRLSGKKIKKGCKLVGFLLFAVVVGFLYLTVGGTTTYGTRILPTHTYIEPMTSEPDPLDGTRWELVAFESKGQIPAIPEQPRLFITFNRGRLSLQGGCNAVGGHYQLEDNRITITFVEATLVDCSASMPGINEIEGVFSNAMPTFESYMIDGDHLRIHYANGVLLFRRISEQTLTQTYENKSKKQPNPVVRTIVLWIQASSIISFRLVNGHSPFPSLPFLSLPVGSHQDQPDGQFAAWVSVAQSASSLPDGVASIATFANKALASEDQLLSMASRRPAV